MPWDSPEKAAFTKGELILLTGGEYDYYAIGGLFTVLVDFDIRDHIDVTVNPKSDAEGRYLADILLTAGLVEEKPPYSEVFAGSYGKWSQRLLCRHDMPRKQVFMNKELGTWTVCPGCDTRMPE